MFCFVFVQTCLYARLREFNSIPSCVTGVSQECFTDTVCSEGQFDVLNKMECCVGTDEGLSFSDGGVCSVCIGKQ